MEKINETAVEPSKTQEIDTGDFGSAPANLIKEVEKKERESRDKPSSSIDMERTRHREDSSRKRKAEDEVSQLSLSLREGYEFPYLVGMSIHIL